MVTIKEKTAKIWEHKVDINVNIVNIVIIVHFVKTSIVQPKPYILVLYLGICFLVMELGV